MPTPTDPLLAQQWHLNQTVSGLYDLNVMSVWNPTEGEAYTGWGTRVVVIDDGIDYLHSDLAPNYHTGLDYEYVTHTDDAYGDPASDWHGTAVAGIIGAAANGAGSVGVAFHTQLVGYRVYRFISDEWLQDIRDAIGTAAISAQGDVINISQGIANDVNSEFGFGYDAARFDEIETSIGTAVNAGRGGLGSIIVKSAGNSRTDDYDVNADDWTNDTRQVVVAAVDQNGFVSSYSSYGAAVLVSGFGTPGQVVTTDRVGADGYSTTDFTSTFNGTSSAAPMVSGVVSLMLDANAGLGWRDVQTILGVSARQVGSEMGAGIAGSERYAWGWNGATTWNGGGQHFSNDYGYGLVDAHAAVRMAETWLLAGGVPQTTSTQWTSQVHILDTATVIPDGNTTGLSFSGTVNYDDIVERVTVEMTFSTTFTADMEIYLVSPDGTVSELIRDVAGSSDYNGTWTFESQAFRGERAAGTWTVRVVDDLGSDVLTVSDIVLRVHADFSLSDRYIYTDEYAQYAGVSNHNTAVVDSNGGGDTVNASAVTTASIIRLDGVTGSIAGQAATFTNIENAIGGDAGDSIYGNTSANMLYGMRGADKLYGGAGADTLDGGTNNDRLDGGADIDTMRGGAGNDIYVVDNAADLVVEYFGEGTDQVIAKISYSLAGLEVENLDLSGGNINGTGNAYANVIDGTAGNNVLDGKAGADKMVGHTGNDTYYVDNASDNVVEDDGEGNDKIIASVSYSLAGRYVETLDLVGTGNINATGNKLNNVLDGNNGNNVLDGKAGPDTMIGKDGNDTYYVDNAGDVVTEANGQGSDKVIATVSYTLSAFIETLDLSGANINGTGNAQANLIDGTSGNNVLDGKAGADKIVGHSGNDTYYVDNAGDNVVEASGEGNDKIISTVSYSLAGRYVETLDLVGTGNINATGNKLNNVLDGNNGNNILNGMAGSDTLLGKGGADTFVFDQALGATNVDTITDFYAPDDSIRLDNAVFLGLTDGALASPAFRANTTGLAGDASDRIIYETDTGELYFDRDGNGTTYDPVLFAILSNKAAIGYQDFLVV
ncbi:S8 family serine peptidase [Oryzicola mucosus]|uniref:S8 family serine peptidase n=1 Tax=Oryzicola mucosus TaxID=2767425 RepID=A0A8J6PGS5_9HYPH|nr:S8 family serine peptidase [Oryzicola mucosus]